MLREIVVGAVIFSQILVIYVFQDTYRELTSCTILLQCQSSMSSISFAKMELNKQQLMGPEWKHA